MRSTFRTIGLAAAFYLLVTGAIPGRADASQTLSYDTTLSTFAVTNTDVVGNGGDSVTFSNGTTSYRVTYTPSTQSYSPFTSGGSVSLGSFVVTDLGGTALDQTHGDTFTLAIHQTNPSTGTNTDVATLNGALTANKGEVLLSFASSSLTVPSAAGPNSVTYSLSNLIGPFGLLVNNLELTPGGTTGASVALNATAVVNATATPDPAPEPSTLLGAFTGALAVAGCSLRRRRRASV